jgi:hypothetical protein
MAPPFIAVVGHKSLLGTYDALREQIANMHHPP